MPSTSTIPQPPEIGSANSITLRRTGVVLHPDPARVLIRPFSPATTERSLQIAARVAALSDADVQALLDQVLTEFGERHLKTLEFLKHRYAAVQDYWPTTQEPSEPRKLLLAAYFSQEYALEAAALFNPSIVPHPDQTGLPPGALRFVLSLRATGEGHISSITFRTGVLDADCRVSVNEPTRYCLEPMQVPNASYHKSLFSRKLSELGLPEHFSRDVVQDLPEYFTLHDLRTRLESTAGEFRARHPDAEAAARKVMTLAQSNYEVQFEPESRLSERVLFPVTPSQSNGIEDARFVKFLDDGQPPMYYATYTAYDGKLILPQLIETPDFLQFRFVTLNGSGVQNKGMALFPRKIHDQFVMLGRQDFESIYIMFSDHPHFWNATQLLLKPAFPWEFVQMGNCGSPIETEAGWLVLSHGVGPMRKYCIGAFLLDRDDPTRVLGRLAQPLIQPNESERIGYVPNVVYSCGGLTHGKFLIVPYAMSDYATSFATLTLSEVLAAMV
jgi:predicted GH43/DUF377 family glycosyl hydrolase